jgi:uncharacterized protein HemX
VAIAALVVAALALALGVYEIRAVQVQGQELDQLRGEGPLQAQRVAELEHRLGEVQQQWNQSLGLGEAGTELAAGDLAARREALALMDIERSVEQTQVQWRLGAPSAAVVDMLAGVEARLARLGTPAAARVLQAVRHDLARLRAAPPVDPLAVTLPLQALLTEVESWRLSADPERSALRPAGSHAHPASAAVSVPAWRAWLEAEFGDLLRVRAVDTPPALLLSPPQQQLLRERVRLGILGLHAAILARDDAVLRSESTALLHLLTQYFDPADPGVALAITRVRAAGAVSGTASGGAGMDETLAALHAVHPAAPAGAAAANAAAPGGAAANAPAAGAPAGAPAGRSAAEGAR